MRVDLISSVFSEFCESHSHLDTLLAAVEPTQKARMAVSLGAVLRRPLTLAKHFNIELESPEEFWKLNFIQLKKHFGMHELLQKTYQAYRLYHELPSEGGVEDFPTALVEEWETDWGAEAAKSFAKNLSQDPLTTVRLHRRAFSADLKTENSHLAEELKKQNLPKMREGYYSPFARVFKGFARVQMNSLFQEGWYETQDEGSQLLALYTLLPDAIRPMLAATPATQRSKFSKPDVPALLHALPKLTVVDACAGAGGKSLALADFMQGQGRVYSYDIFEKKLQRLRKRAERAQERNIQAVLLSRHEEATGQLEKYGSNADRVLVDSPCTGNGVLRRNPDIKWARKPFPKREGEVALTIDELQKKVIRDYAPLTKSGGVFVYGVCSFSKKETVDQVQWIQESIPSLKLRSQGFIGPHETDGFFMAAFQKID